MSTANEISRSRLRKRLDTYLIDHYLGLHNTVIGVALAVAGLAAASLIGVPKGYHDYQIALWILWAGSLLSVVVAYAGAAIGAIILPPRVPAIFDLIIPLLIGVFEFLLFGLLAHQATGVFKPNAVIVAWFYSFTGFCLCGAAGVWRAACIIRPEIFTPDLRFIVKWYRRRLYLDIVSALSMGGVSAIGGTGITLYPGSITLIYVISSIIVVGLSAALISQANVASMLRRTLR